MSDLTAKPPETDSDISLKVRQVIARQLGVLIECVRPDCLFVNDLGVDSLKIMKIVMALEEEFNLELPHDVIDKIRFVSDVIDYFKTQSVKVHS